MNEDKKSYIINEIDDKTKEEMNKEWKNTTKLIDKINSIDLDNEILEIKFKKGKGYNKDDVRLTVIQKLKNYKAITNIYVNLKFKFEEKTYYRTFCLANDKARNVIYGLFE